MEVTPDLPVNRVALPQAQRVCQMHLTDLCRPVRLVNSRHPVVAPPVREQAWIVEPEDIDVCPMYKVVRQDGRVTAAVVRSDNTDERWIVTFQLRDEFLCPAARQHPCIIVDAVEVVDVVEIGFQHGVILSPGRFSGVCARNQGEVGGDVAVSTRSGRCRRVEISPECVAQLRTGEHLIAAIVRQVELVEEL